MKKLLRRGLSLAMVAGLVAVPATIPALAQDGGDATISHRQSVLTQLSATGELDASRVFTQLTVTGEGPVEVVLPDQSTRGLRDLGGLGRPNTDDDDVIYGIDATPAGVHKRTVANNTADLPVSLDVAYELDGEPIENPSDIVGRSGELTVSYTVRNETVEPQELDLFNARQEPVTETVDVGVPIVGTISLPLDNRFSDIEAQGANIAGDGRGNTVVNFSLVLFEPLGAFEQTVSWSAQVTDAALPDTNVQLAPVTSDSFKSLPDAQSAYADTFVGLQTITDGAVRIDMTMVAILDGASQLLDGMNQLADGSQELATGLESAASGSRDLADGTGQAHAGSQELASGLGDLRDGAGQVADGTGQVAAGAGQLAGGLGEIHTGTASAADGVGEVWQGIQGIGGNVEDALPSALATELEKAILENMEPALKAELGTATSDALADALAQNMGPALAQALKGNMPGPMGDALNGALLEHMSPALRDALLPALANAMEPALAGALKNFFMAPPPNGFGMDEATATQAANGFAAGFSSTETGFPAGFAPGFASADSGFPAGFAASPFAPGFAAGFADGFSAPFATGFEQGFTAEFAPAFGGGLAEGFAKPFTEGFAGAFAPAFGSGFGSGFATEFGQGVVAGFSPGVSALIDGMGQLTDGTAEAATGAGDLASGAAQLDDGANQLAAGSVAAAAGGQDLSSGLGEIDTGANQLADGLGDARDGSGQLAEGMGDAHEGGQSLVGAMDELQEFGTNKILNDVSRAGLQPDRLLKQARAADDRAKAGDGLPYGTAEGADASAVYQFEIAGVGGEEGASTPTRAGAAVLAFGAAAALGLGVRRRLI